MNNPNEKKQEPQNQNEQQSEEVQEDQANEVNQKKQVNQTDQPKQVKQQNGKSGEIHEAGQKKKRKRRRKKKLRRHPPQYYEQRRILKYMKQRQNLWDDRFNYESLPRISNIQIRVPQARQKLKSLRKSQSKQVKIYKTFNVESQDSRAKPSKSFNIRVIYKKQEKQSITGSKKQIRQEQNRPYHQQKSRQKYKRFREQLIDQVIRVHKELNFSECHRNYLVDLIDNSNRFSVKNYIQFEIGKLRNKSSTCSTLQNIIKKRQAIIQQFKQQKDNISQQNIKKYRLSTIRVIQEMLKWKEEAETTYQQHANIKPRLNYMYKGQNYLLKISKELSIPGVIEKFDCNPFLLGYQNNPVDNQLIIKIRACQMLLLEQQINNS